ncbi:MAG: UbiA family prenyltransferase [bacterium]|nr:UbiA family prenyltransferase [bacterium]
MNTRNINRDEQLPYAVYTFGFWKKYWVHMRPYLLFLSGIAGLVGMALAPTLDLVAILCGFFPLFFAYGMGQALTDTFQIDTDTISSPYRPLVKGEVTPKAVASVSVLGLSAGVGVLAFINPWLMIPGALAIVGLASYTPFKRTWWGGPPWNSWIVALLPLMGRMVDPGFSPAASFGQFDGEAVRLLLAMAVVFFAYANFVVGGYFKDLTADRETNYQTFQVRFGWTAGATYSTILAILAITFTFLTIYPVVMQGGVAGIVSISILVLTAAANFIAQVKLHKTRDESKTHGPITMILRSFLLYCLVIIIAYKPEWLIAIAIYYAVFEVNLLLRPEKSQL